MMRRVSANRDRRLGPIRVSNTDTLTAAMNCMVSGKRPRRARKAANSYDPQRNMGRFLPGEEAKRIGSMGGKASAECGRGHRFTSEKARAAGAKGNETRERKRQERLNKERMVK